jgi:hypothetical protein
MNECVARFPELKLFSLPAFVGADGLRRLELGVRGPTSRLDEAMVMLITGVEAGGFRWETVVGERTKAAGDAEAAGAAP